MNPVVIIDYGMGNLRSVLRKFERLEIPALISNSKGDLFNASRLVLPGVGHFAEGMKNLHSFGLVPILNELVVDKKIPILGICLGMQLMTTFSEEGDVEGLGWVNAKTKKFSFGGEHSSLRVPHVGWNLATRSEDSNLFQGIPPEKRFYFVHSYYVWCENSDDVLATTNYGITFHSALKAGSIFGTQFHPEKSHVHGLQLIKNFIQIT